MKVKETQGSLSDPLCFVTQFTEPVSRWWSCVVIYGRYFEDVCYPSTAERRQSIPFDGTLLTSGYNYLLWPWTICGNLDTTNSWWQKTEFDRDEIYIYIYICICRGTWRDQQRGASLNSSISRKIFKLQFYWGFSPLPLPPDLKKILTS